MGVSVIQGSIPFLLQSSFKLIKSLDISSSLYLPETSTSGICFFFLTFPFAYNHY